MDSIIPFGQKNTLAEYMILSGADNRPLMLEKDLVTRTKKYDELFATEKIQADCDIKERSQLLMQGTSLTKHEIECKLYDAFDKFAHIKGESLHQYYLRFTQPINHINIYKMKLEEFQVNTMFLNSLPPEWSKFLTDVKLVKDLHTTNFDQLYAYLQQHELHATVRLIRERNQDPLALVANHQITPPHFNTYQSSYNNPQGKVLLVEGQGNSKVLNEEELEFLADPSITKGPVTQLVITHNLAYQANDLDVYDTDCDEISTTKSVLMANLSSYSSDVLFEVPHSDNTHNDMLNQSVKEMTYSEQTHLVNYLENEITSDSNITSYSQYLLETQYSAVQSTNSYTQQDVMILSVFEQLSHQVTNCNNINKDNLMANESLSAEIERYKERVKLLDKKIKYGFKYSRKAYNR
nr:hypothetical protein [Tanacetum cinerariifolium]